MKKIYFITSILSILLSACNSSINDSSIQDIEILQNDSISASSVEKNNILRTFTGYVESTSFASLGEHYPSPGIDPKEKIKVLRIESKGALGGLSRNINTFKFATEVDGHVGVFIRFGKNGKLYLTSAVKVNPTIFKYQEIGTYEKPLEINKKVKYKFNKDIYLDFKHHSGDLFKGHDYDYLTFNKNIPLTIEKVDLE
jgi:hypothetical protein